MSIFSDLASAFRAIADRFDAADKADETAPVDQSHVTVLPSETNTETTATQPHNETVDPTTSQTEVGTSKSATNEDGPAFDAPAPAVTPPGYENVAPPVAPGGYEPVQTPDPTTGTTEDLSTQNDAG